MTEKRFIEQNIEKWRELEELLGYSESDPEKLHSLFVEVSSDLSYARTYFPNRSVRLYLNNLTQQVFDKLKKGKKKFDKRVVLDFFAHVLPREVYKHKKYFVISLLIFSLAVVIGAFSTAQNPDFAAVILGDDYLEITNQNINDGDPMKIYKDSEKVDMFFGITVNNIRVSFMVFVLGILGSVGTVFILMYNGIMLGTFQYYFYTKGLFATSFLTIWIHGTIEISAIIIAGAAGLVLGKGVLFPGTYHRSSALQVSALSAIRILLGTIPLFVLAGVLESFVTRYTGMPTFVKAGIIVLSLAFILFMWVWYPYHYHKTNELTDGDGDFIPASDDRQKPVREQYRPFEEHFALSLKDYQESLSHTLRSVVFPFWLGLCFSIWLILEQTAAQSNYVLTKINIFDLTHWSNNVLLVISFGLLISKTLHNYLEVPVSYLEHIKKYGWLYGVVSVMITLPFILLEVDGYILLYFLFFPPHFWFIFLKYFIADELPLISALTSAYSNAWSYVLMYLSDYLVTFMYYYLVYLLLVKGLGSIFYELLVWHNLFDTQQLSELYFNLIMRILGGALVLPFFFVSVLNKQTSLLCRDTGLDLERKIANFGKPSSIIETK